MADEHVERDSPADTSEATPPRIDDSPEMVNQPSPPEEERVTSSSDHQQPEIGGPPEERRVSSSSECSTGRPSTVGLLLQGNEAATEGNPSSSQGGSSSDPAPEINRPYSNDAQNSPLRQLLFSPAVVPQNDRPELPRFRAPLIDTGRVESAVEVVQTEPKVAQIKTAAGPSREITKQVVKLNVDEDNSDCNQQFDMEDSSCESKSSPETTDLGSDSSPIGSDNPDEGQGGSGSSASVATSLESDPTPQICVSMDEESSLVGSGSSASVATSLESDPTPQICVSMDEESSLVGASENICLDSESSASITGDVASGSGAGTTENVGLKSKLSPLKTVATTPSSEAGATEKIRLKDELSPSKTDAASVEGSSSASGLSEKVRDKVSPKRKSPTKVQHLPAKKSSPFTSPDKHPKQSDLHMSTLLEDLELGETMDQPGCSTAISEHEPKSMETEESEDQKEEAEESNMEDQEADSQNTQDETAENSKKEDSKKDSD